MAPIYANTFIESDRAPETYPENDRAPHAPMLGFVSGIALSTLLWAIIALGIWRLFA